MKKLLLIPIFISLTACAQLTKLYDSYMLAPYDNVEYSLVTRLRTQAELTMDKCNTKEEVLKDLKAMNQLSRELKNFSQYVPDNKDTIAITTSLYKMVNGTLDHYQKNEIINNTYCTLKLKQIISSAETAQKVIGSRPR